MVLELKKKNLIMLDYRDEKEFKKKIIHLILRNNNRMHNRKKNKIIILKIISAN